jgi:adenosyl cobinamide kinase/adenosyl cobinamide phosphate guanylyltransferase
MEPIEQYVKLLEKSIPSETMFIDALQDLIKDEIKEYMKEKIDKNTELKKEIKEAVKQYMEAKLKEVNAIAMLSKVAAEMGLAVMPADLKNQFLKNLVSVFSKEIDKTIEKTI